ncbi:hypothetical protein ACFTZM_35870 [Streptomyces hydrogenans]|uniref:hypothetical protein n=1 Tax=Streptomyces hydrogenans TaxID=1873719 RepID=UPI0036399E6B
MLRVEVWVRRRRRLARGPGAAARARREVHLLADQALLLGHAVSRRSEDDAALVTSELVAAAGGGCVLELTVAPDGLDILVSGVRPPGPPRGGSRPYVVWWDLVSRVARDTTVCRDPACDATVRARIDLGSPTG